MTEESLELIRSGVRNQFSLARFHPGTNPHVAARIIGAPLMIDPMKLTAILAGIGERIGLQGFVPAADAGSTLVRRDRSNSYANVDGVAVLDLMGSIVKRNEGGVLNSSGLFSLEAAKEVVATAKADTMVRGLLVHEDTNGGEAVGTPEFARWLFDQRGDGKPIWCSIDDAAYSAGAYIATACERVFVTPTGGGGSIGVVGIHVDASEAYANEGYKITPIFAGERKIDGASFMPLSDEARARFQAHVDSIWEMFKADVAEFRASAGLTVGKLTSYQAVTFHGADLVAAKLADGVATFDDVLTEFQSRVSGAPARKQGGQRMSDRINVPGAPTESPGADNPKVVPMDQYRTDTDAAKLAGRAEERERCTRIDRIAAVARMPRADAEKLATRLKTEGVSVEKAQDAFCDAVVEADAVASSKTEITGRKTPDDLAAVAGIRTYEMRPREDVVGSRFQSPAIKKRQAALAAVSQLVASNGLVDKAVEGGF